MSHSENNRFRIGVDTGGTFVDAVEFNETDHTMKLAKSPTTPSDPTRGFLNAVQKLGTPLQETYIILHGTTLGVNAIIQHKGVNTGIITNKGFRDIFEIGRGDVPPEEMYDFNYQKPQSLVKRRNIIGVDCRVDSNGEILTDLDEDALKTSLQNLVEQQSVESIAISYLHSYKNPVHEQKTIEILSKAYPRMSFSASSDVVSEYREYERTSTTVLDAYIKPLVAEYLQKLARSLSDKGFRGLLLIMRSDGGVMSVQTAATSPISTVQSGPAGGVVGASFISGLLGKNKMITMDIGGTSLDVCVLDDGQANVIHQSYLEHYPLLMTMYDIRSIGAGGGSVASVSSGLLKVGPESAGADPGPMCYNKGGTKPTVTDASVVLGYIDPANFLAGEIPLKPELSARGIEEQVAIPLGVNLVEAAAGIMKVTATNSMSAIRQITVEEGRDPADYSMLSFGGAGPLFATILAKELEIPEVIVPIAPAAFSAYGMLMCDISYEISQTFISQLEKTSIDTLNDYFARMEKRIQKILEDQKAGYQRLVILRKLELRYLGQEHTLEIDLKKSLDNSEDLSSLRKAFDELHFARYGHKMKDPVEIVNLRVRGIGALDKPKPPQIRKKDSATSKDLGQRKAFCLVRDEMTDFSIVRRSDLSEGDAIDGPAIVDEGVARTIIHSGQKLRVDEYGNLIIRI
jgi:N-methylhydantoinase A